MPTPENPTLLLATLAVLVTGAAGLPLAAQEPPRPKEAAAKPADARGDKADPLFQWLESFFPWGAGESKMEEMAVIKVPGYRVYRLEKKYSVDPKPADQLFAAVEEGGKFVLVGDAIGDEARLKNPVPVRTNADLLSMRDLLKRGFPGTPRLSLEPSLDRKEWKGVLIRRETGYGEYPIPAYISARDGSVLILGHFWDRTRSVAEQRREVLKLADTPAVGPADARVTVVEFSDMECPSCKKRTSDWDALQAKLAKELRIRRYVKSFPLTDAHPWAFRAASAARCFFEKSPELYFRYKSNVYARQEELNVAAVDAFSLAFAVDNGVPEDYFKGCYLQARMTQKILADMAEGWTVRVRSTPTYFVDGVAVSWFADTIMEEFLRSTYLGGKGLPLPTAAPVKTAPTTGR
ncbi:MAG: thioredoxin domain-containing protein [Thermoanaerobaculia bacterium]